MTALKPEELEDRARQGFGGMVPDLAERCREFAVDASEVEDEMMSIFKPHIGGVIAAIAVAAANRSEPEIRRSAHSLRGMGGTIGVPTLSVVAAELSEAAKRGDYSGCLALARGLQEWDRAWSLGRATS